EKQKSTPYLSSFYAPKFGSPFEKRRFRFINSLFHALARVGGPASARRPGAEGLGVTIGPVHLGFKLGPLKPPPATYPPTQLGAREKMKLALEWYQPPAEVKLLWADDEGQRLEDQIEEIAVSLAAYAEWGYRRSLQRQ